MAKNLDYRGKIILAPMVRIGTLPTRLVALDYGADLVYTEEIIDLKMLRCTRVENQMLGTIDFVMNDETIAFRTCPREKEKVVFQIGTADPQRALKVGKMIENDVAAIDVNMGCPKEYSVKGGMGAALLSQPDNVKEILTTLVNGLSIPVTCKIRLLPTLEETLGFVKMVESTGVAALGVHGRLKEERPRHANHNEAIKKIAESISIPVIANGGSKAQIKKFEDIEKFRESCGASSVMLARAAQWVPSIFSPSGQVPIHDTVKKYLKYALDYDNTPTNIKYNVQTMLHEEMESPHGHALMAAGTLREISSIWDLDKYYEEKHNERTKHKKMQVALCHPKEKTLDNGQTIWEMEFRYYKRDYRDNITPKMVLHQWVRQNNLPKPEFDTVENVKEQHFISVLSVEGTKYGSTLWDKSKKAAEQAAAAVYLKVKGIYDGRKEYDDTQCSGQIRLPMFEERDATKKSDSKNSAKQVAESEPTDSMIKGAEVFDSATDSLEAIDSAIKSEGEAEVFDSTKDSQIGLETQTAVKREADCINPMPKKRRSSSMPEFIDDLIEKHIRLYEDEPEPETECDTAVIQSFVDRHTQNSDKTIPKSEDS